MNPLQEIADSYPHVPEGYSPLMMSLFPGLIALDQERRQAAAIAANPEGDLARLIEAHKRRNSS